MAKLPIGTLVKIEKNVVRHGGHERPRADQKYVGEVGKIVHICPDWFVSGLPLSLYKLRMKDGNEIWWVDENDITVVGFLTS